MDSCLGVSKEETDFFAALFQFSFGQLNKSLHLEYRFTNRRNKVWRCAGQTVRLLARPEILNRLPIHVWEELLLNKAEGLY